MTEDSGIAESSDDSEEAILTKMKCLAQDLEQKLSLDSNLVQEITQVCDNFEKKKIAFSKVTQSYFIIFYLFQTLKSSTSDLEERLLEKRCSR